MNSALTHEFYKFYKSDPFQTFAPALVQSVSARLIHETVLFKRQLGPLAISLR
jgi:hypothetical protein